MVSLDSETSAFMGIDRIRRAYIYSGCRAPLLLCKMNLILVTESVLIFLLRVGLIRTVTSGVGFVVS